jgi:cytochrome c-type biogenesis protein CcmH
MTLWLILALMTVGALSAVLWPLYRRPPRSHSGSELNVYRDQLKEIERDYAAGHIATTEAEAARIEVSRRLLAAADVTESATSPSDETAIGWRRRAVALVVLGLLPVGAAGFYLKLGSPESAAQPIQSRYDSAPDQRSVESMVAQVEAHLTRKPGDGRAWEVLAPVYLRLGRYEDSVRAWQNALSILGENADREENLGESLVTLAGGVVTAEAKAAFDQALAIDRNAVAARFYLGLAAAQDGRRKDAQQMWHDLIASAPEGAHWVGSVREALARLEGGAVEEGPNVEGPTTREMQAAAKLPTEQQDAMVRGMVDRLAARLKSNSGDVDGWIRLVRSYNVLGERDNASAAVAEARRALAADPAKMSRLEQALQSGGTVASANPIPGSTDGAEAKEQPSEQQNGMIRSMVDRLAARLKANGGDVDGWIMLVRSYNVLGERDNANAAVADARRALATDPEKMSRLEQALQSSGGAVASASPIPGSTDGAEAKEQPSEQQNGMIRSMVDRLAARLKQDGSDVDAWLRLIRSYTVLGERDKARDAAADARKAIGDDAQKLRRLEEGTRALAVQ